MGYGNGITAPGIRHCGSWGLQENCFLQQKRLDVLSYDQCINKIFRIFWEAFVKPNGPLSDEELASMIAGTEEEVRSSIQKLRKAYTDFESSMGDLEGDAMKSDHTRPQQPVDAELLWTLEQPVDPDDLLLTSQVHEKLKSHMQEL